MIAATDLTLELDGRRILERISFEVARGESVALVGPNGSGKTSILRCLLGLVPFSGSAAIGGHDVVREPVAARSLAGYVPQKPAFTDASAIEVVTFAAKLRRLDREQAVTALRSVGLEEAARRRVRTFSGGMQQRLSLAVALLGDPPVLLLDEPTAYLDEAAQAAFLETVRELRQRSSTLLLALHRAEEVTSLADRVLFLNAGRIVSEETTLGGEAAVISSLATWRVQ